MKKSVTSEMTAIRDEEAAGLAMPGADAPERRPLRADRQALRPARLVEGQRVMGWREALNELDLAYPGRLR